MNCCVCGKALKWYGSNYKISNFKLDFPEEKNEMDVCSDCGSILYGLADVIELKNKKINATNSVVRMNFYKDRIRVRKAQCLEKCPEKWMRSKLDEFIATADKICDDYDYYKDYLYTAFDIIEDSINRLPEERIDYATSTFAVDEDILYYMQYGNPICNNKSILEIESVKDRMDTIEQLTNNVINRQCLIEVIPKDNIIYFQEKGEIGYSTDVGGGGSKGVSYGGAVIGGLLFGGAGAVVGAMSGNKVDEIKSKAVEHDNRYIVIRFIDDTGKTVERKASYGYFDVLNTLIPEKEYSYIQLNTTSIEPVNKMNLGIPVEELKALKELLDIGVITESEFDAKKKQLLGI